MTKVQDLALGLLLLLLYCLFVCFVLFTCLFVSSGLFCLDTWICIHDVCYSNSYHFLLPQQLRWCFLLKEGWEWTMKEPWCLPGCVLDLELPEAGYNSVSTTGLYFCQDCPGKNGQNMSVIFGWLLLGDHLDPDYQSWPFWQLSASKLHIWRPPSTYGLSSHLAACLGLLFMDHPTHMPTCPSDAPTSSNSQTLFLSPAIYFFVSLFPFWSPHLSYDLHRIHDCVCLPVLKHQADGYMLMFLSAYSYFWKSLIWFFFYWSSWMFLCYFVSTHLPSSWICPDMSKYWLSACIK